jgi:hypothetical protein
LQGFVWEPIEDYEESILPKTFEQLLQDGQVKANNHMWQKENNTHIMMEQGFTLGEVANWQETCKHTGHEGINT